MLILAAVLPLLPSGGWVASDYAQQARANMRQLAYGTVGRVAERLADKLSGQLQVIEALAASTALDDSNLEAFRQAAARVLALHPLWRTIELTALSGAQVLNMLRADGATLGRTADLDRFRQVVDSDHPAVGSIGPIGPVSGRRQVTLRVPVLRAGALRYVLSFAMAPDSVATILETAGAPAEWIGVAVDASGHIIARTVAGGSKLGEMAGDTLRQAMARPPAGIYAGRSLEGV